jgi:hypothetical protein
VLSASRGLKTLVLRAFVRVCCRSGVTQHNALA